jgi:hypothetical protein
LYGPFCASALEDDDLSARIRGELGGSIKKTKKTIKAFSPFRKEERGNEQENRR